MRLHKFMLEDLGARRNAKRAASLDLSNISLPILADRLRRKHSRHWPEVGLLLGATGLVQATAAMAQRRIWTAAEDQIHTHDIRQAVAGLGLRSLTKIVNESTYARVLYREYRNPLVHGLTLGWGAWMGNEPRDADGPQYTNRILGTGRQHHVRTPIAFGRPLLARILRGLIAEEEKACRDAAWEIPESRTLDEPET